MMNVVLCCALETDGKNSTVKRIYKPIMIFVCASCNILVFYLPNLKVFFILFLLKNTYKSCFY